MRVIVLALIPPASNFKLQNSVHVSHQFLYSRAIAVNRIKMKCKTKVFLCLVRFFVPFGSFHCSLFDSCVWGKCEMMIIKMMRGEKNKEEKARERERILDFYLPTIYDNAYEANYVFSCCYYSPCSLYVYSLWRNWASEREENVSTRCSPFHGCKYVDI